MKLLVANAGSTSLKFKVYEMPAERTLCTGKVERVGSLRDAIFSYRNCLSGYAEDRDGLSVPSYTEGIALFIDRMCGAGSGNIGAEGGNGVAEGGNGGSGDGNIGIISDISEIGAVGFKTVAAKGFLGTHLITGEVLQGMRDYLPVAPAHNTAYLEAIGCFREMLPGVPFVGAFETDFHRTIPPHRFLYSVPYEWYEKYGVRKLGYHGASHSYAASVLTEKCGTTGNAVICHLGGSGSLCAVADGKSVDTSFGMSLQTGLPQNNRSGDLDPYVIRYLEAQGLTENDIFAALTKESGFLGMSGISNDLRYLTDAADAGNERAQIAIDSFADAVLRYIGGYAAEMGGLDNLVFTGGIGENSVSVREKVCRKLAFLGLDFDAQRNENVRKGEKASLISADGSKVRAWVIPADEEIMVARRTYRLLSTEEN